MTFKLYWQKLRKYLREVFALGQTTSYFSNSSMVVDGKSSASMPTKLRWSEHPDNQNYIAMLEHLEQYPEHRVGCLVDRESLHEHLSAIATGAISKNLFIQYKVMATENPNHVRIKVISGGPGHPSNN